VTYAQETSAESTALAAIVLARSGRFAELRDMFAPQLQALVTAEALRAGWDAQLDRDGPVTSIGTPASEPVRAGVVVVTIPVSCERGQLAARIAVYEAEAEAGAAGEASVLAGLQFLPVGPGAVTGPWQPPAYASQDKFSEQDVLVGSGPLAVPGTLSLPTESGLPNQPGQPAESGLSNVPGQPPRSPAIVLLGGSGPCDRDESVGQNKPFKDLAWGLASLGIAVLRFDKVTFAHRAEMAAAADFTLADEYLPDALAAIELLRRHPSVDPERIFVLGHSLGGTVAPRVAAEAQAKADAAETAETPSIAGLIILAGGTQPLQRTIVRQLEYIAALNPETEEASRPGIEAMAEKARLVDSPELTPSTPSSDLPFGAPAPYWLDLRGYDPVATASAIDLPMLILQGGRDYQATVTEDLAGWKAGLEERPDVTFRIFPADNHFFLPGSGPSSPAEYGPGQHVDPEVVADIANWISATGAA
jgi:dienelactone hydrolase